MSAAIAYDLLFAANLNISTSHFTSTPSTFEVILQLTCYTNYLLMYLLTYNAVNPSASLETP